MLKKTNMTIWGKQGRYTKEPNGTPRAENTIFEMKNAVD